MKIFWIPVVFFVLTADSFSQQVIIDKKDLAINLNGQDSIIIPGPFPDLYLKYPDSDSGRIGVIPIPPATKDNSRFELIPLHKRNDRVVLFLNQKVLKKKP